MKLMSTVHTYQASNQKNICKIHQGRVVNTIRGQYLSSMAQIFVSSHAEQPWNQFHYTSWEASPLLVE